MPYLDTTYVDNRMGADLVTSLFTDSGVLVTAARTAALDAATARVRAALRTAGYTPPSDAELATMTASADGNTKGEGQFVQDAAFGAFVLISFARKQLKVIPEFLEETKLLAQIRTGEARFTTITLSTRAAVGGVEFSDSSSSSASARRPVFTRQMKR